MPNAKIVIDTFHVVRMANEALERVRKGLREQFDAQTTQHPRKLR
jgi:transposase